MRPCPDCSTPGRANLTAETAFTVLAMARSLKAQGQGRRRAGDRRQPVPQHAARQGGRHPGDRGEPDRLRPEPGPARVPRAAAARFVNAEFGYRRSAAENIVVASGAKPFEQYFAEALLDPGDGVLVFSPHFPTYVPNLERRGARAVLVPLRAEHEFRPRAEDVARLPGDRPEAPRRSSSTRRTTRPAAWRPATTWPRSPTWSGGPT